MRARDLFRRARAGWDGLLASPGGKARVARGIAAGAASAMIPAFGLHLVIAAGLALLLRASLPAAAAACLAIGNPLTHAFLLPLEFAIGRFILPPGVDFLPHTGPAWLLSALPAAEETLVGGLLLAMLAAPIAWVLAWRGMAGR